MKPTFILNSGSELERAIHMATLAHLGQVDKGGQPYILHPLRVMAKLSGRDNMIIGVLHDVIEDTEVTHDDIGQVFGIQIANAVATLTKHPGMSRITYLRQVGRWPEMMAIKLCDIEDNISADRIYHLKPAKREKLLKKYKADLLFIKNVLGYRDMAKVNELLQRFKK